LKTVRPLAFGLLCAGLCAAICAGQEQTPPRAAPSPAPSETSGIVHGKVVQDPGGQGIRKVKVSLRGTSGQRREQYDAVTDEAGQFKFEDVEPGTYFLQLERSGYAEGGKSSRDRIINVSTGQDTKDLLFHMTMAGVITGKIVDFDGDPLPGISVVATPSAGTAKRNIARPGNAATNDLGEYRIADLPPGKYIVQATPPENQAALSGPKEKNAPKDRLVFVSTYFPGTLDERQAIAVEVPAGGTAAADFGLQATRVYRVSGTVIGLSAPPKPQPQSGGNMAFMVSSGQGIGQLILVGKNGQTKEQNLREDGTFEFSGVPAGTYRAQLVSFAGFLSGQGPPLKMQAFRTPIEVNGSDVVGLQLQVEASGDVSGKFRMEGNEKIDWKQLYVILVPKSEEGSEGMGMMPTGQAMLNEDGSFEIKDAPAGDCQLAVGTGSDKFRDYYTKSVLLGGREVVDTGFSVSPGTVLDVVVGAKGAGVEGTVVDAAGKPVAQANVVTLPSSGKLGRPDAYQFGQTDARGHFDLRGMNPGEFLVLAFEEIQEDYRTPEFVKKYEGKGEKVDLQEGAKKSVTLKLITGEGEKP